MNTNLSKASTLIGALLNSTAKPLADDIRNSLNQILVSINEVDAKINIDQPQVTVDSLLGHDYVVSWNINYARTIERSLSAEGIPPRMNVGMVLMKRVGNNYEEVGVIGGYTDFLEKTPVHGGKFGPVMLYQPVFNITVCNSSIPGSGILAILMACFAPSIYNSKIWLMQWNDLRPGNPHPGFLEEDHSRPGNPIILADRQELLKFANAYFTMPTIAIDWNEDCGLGAYGTELVDKLTNFFKVSSGNEYGSDSSVVFDHSLIATPIGNRTVGKFKDTSGEFKDSREVDYLYIAAKNDWSKIDRDIRAVLLGGEDVSGSVRDEIINTFVDDYTPLYTMTQLAINPRFVQWLVSIISKTGIKIIDPNSSVTNQPLGSFGKSSPSSV